MLRSDLCDYSDPYIVVKRIIIIEGRNNRDIKNTSLPIINNVPFTDCISNINNVLIGNAKNLYVVMLMYNLIEYSKNFRKSTGNLCNYYRDKPNNPPFNDDDPPTVNYNADPITDSTSFKYKDNDDSNYENDNRKETKMLKLFCH